MLISPMAFSQTVTGVRVEDYEFPPAIKALGSDKPFFLGGAGARGLEIEGRFIKFTAIGVYLEESAITTLSGKWKGKTADELTGSIEFFRDIVTGPFEKFTQVTMILPLTGQQYSEKVAENSVAAWKAMGIYTDEKAKAITEFLEIFKDENMSPGNSVLFTQSPLGSLTIGFSEHNSIPEIGKAVIRNKALSEAVLESIIGEHGVSPAAKQSLAARLSELMMSADVEVKAANNVVKELECTKEINVLGLLKGQQGVTA